MMDPSRNPIEMRDGVAYYVGTNIPVDLTGEEPVGYDGFGAPIYAHQEEPMPTDLPEGFKGTKPQPKPDSNGPWWQHVLALAVVICTIDGSWHIGTAIVHMVR